MANRIEIRNFGPLKEVDIDLDKDLYVFIGPQASGKSTIVKLIHMYYALPVSLSLILEVNPEGLTLKILKEVLIVSGFDFILNENFKLRFTYMDNAYVEISDKENCFEISDVFSMKLIYAQSMRGDNHQTVYDETVKTGRKLMDNNKLDAEDFRNEPTSNFYRTILSVFGLGATLFVPTERSAFLKGFTPPPINENSMEHANSHLQHKIFRESTYLFDKKDLNLMINQEVVTLAKRILKSEYQFEPNRLALYINSNQIPFSQLSSGQLSTLTLIDLLFITVNSSSFYPRTLLIEEPEVHLFPDSQKDLIALMAMALNASAGKLFITTHSPYILTSLNNHIYAGNLAAELPPQDTDRLEKVKAIMPEDQWLTHQRVAAYFVDNGTIRSIMDDDEKPLQQSPLMEEHGIMREHTYMIDAGEIDKISNVIYEIQDQLDDIKYAKPPQPSHV